jgi:hypothetical protein
MEEVMQHPYTEPQEVILFLSIFRKASKPDSKVNILSLKRFVKIFFNNEK